MTFVALLCVAFITGWLVRDFQEYHEQLQMRKRVYELDPQEIKRRIEEFNASRR